MKQKTLRCIFPPTCGEKTNGNRKSDKRDPIRREKRTKEKDQQGEKPTWFASKQGTQDLFKFSLKNCKKEHWVVPQ
jgi:hypothetical protein